jgi:hypothetical protein
MNDGTTAVQAEHQALRRQLDEKIADIQPHLSTIKLSCGSDASEYVIRTARVSLNFCLYIAFPPTESRIVVQEFDRPLILPGTRSGTFIGGHGPSLGQVWLRQNNGRPAEKRCPSPGRTSAKCHPAIRSTLLRRESGGYL